MKKEMLLGTASVAALTAATTTHAVADEHEFQPSTSISMMGSVGLLNNAPYDKLTAESGGAMPPEEYNDKFGNPAGDMGYVGSVALEHRLTEQFDIGASATLGFSTANQRDKFEDFGSGFGEGHVTNEFNFQALDAEVGFRPAEMNDVRLFAGVRSLNTASTSDKVGTDVNADPEGSGGYNRISSEMSSTFTGTGLRVGAEYSQAVAVGSYGFTGKVGAAALQGTNHHRVSATYESGYYSSGFYSGFGQSNSEEYEETGVTAYSLDAAIGVDYRASENTTISFGYQAQQFWNVDIYSDTDEEFFGPSEGYNSPRLIHGVFVGMTTNF